MCSGLFSSSANGVNAARASSNRGLWTSSRRLLSLWTINGFRGSKAALASDRNEWDVRFFIATKVASGQVYWVGVLNTTSERECHEAACCVRLFIKMIDLDRFR